MMHLPPERFDASVGATVELPARPDASVLNEAIPLFFIGRNRNGLWLAREAGGRAGGIFLFRESALRFAGLYSLPGGCATMILKGRFELDIPSQGSPLVVWLDAAIRMAVNACRIRSHARRAKKFVNLSSSA